ncbi:MAG: hypothetical protein ACI81T_002113 [Bacteroidia bacterium]
MRFDLLRQNEIRPVAIRAIDFNNSVAGCFRTLRWAQRHSRIFGFIATVRKNDSNIFDQLKLVFNGKTPELIRKPFHFGDNSVETEHKVNGIEQLDCTLKRCNYALIT